jgi:hypothetical protein
MSTLTQQIMRPVKTILFTLLVGLVGLGIIHFYSSVQAKQLLLNQPGFVDQQAGSNTVYLPLVGNKMCLANGEQASPFSLQIAALHQISAQMVASLSSIGAYDEINRLDRELLDAAFPTLLDALKESGAGGTRIYVKWSEIEPVEPQAGQPPVYDWASYDDKLRLIAETGVNIIATIADAPGWAAATPCTPFGGATNQQFAQFMSDIVSRYSQPPYGVKTWELINEPDNTWPNGYNGGLGCWGFNGKEYAAVLKTAYPAIKSADPQATVLFGGVAQDWFTEYAGPFYRYFPDDVMNNGAGSSYDAFNFHYFPDFTGEWERWDPNSQDRKMGWLPAPTCGDEFDGKDTAYEAGGIDVIAKATFLRNRMQACFGSSKPIWITEIAEHGYENDPSSLDKQARYVIQGNVRALAAGVKNITWYALSTPNDSYQQGLLNDDWTPKPAFYAFQTLTKELKFYTYSRTLTIPGGEGYVFQDGCGTEKTVAWGAGASLWLNGWTKAHTVDYLGNSQTIQDGGAGDADGRVDGSISLSLTAGPMFFEP